MISLGEPRVDVDADRSNCSVICKVLQLLFLRYTRTYIIGEDEGEATVRMQLGMGPGHSDPAGEIHR